MSESDLWMEIDNHTTILVIEVDGQITTAVNKFCLLSVGKKKKSKGEKEEERNEEINL